MKRGRRHPFQFAVAAFAAATGLLFPAHAQIQIAGTLFVSVDATTLPVGSLNAITNRGTLGGHFSAVGGGDTVPQVALAGGSSLRGIQFDGGDFLMHVSSIGGPVVPAPVGLVGIDPTRSIEVWVFNPAIPSEETMVAWGKRGGPNGSNMSFNYGSNGTFGAAGHWGGPDLGWGGGAPPAGQWHHLVYTFDGNTTRVYVDGVLQNSETLASGAIDTHVNTPICLATQLEADGITPTSGLRGSLTLGRVRVHDGVLDDAQIFANYSLEAGDFVASVATPLVAAPVHRYSFTESATNDGSGELFVDSLGTAHGTVRGVGAMLTGSRLKLAGGDSSGAAYGDLPNGLLSSQSADFGGTGEVTIETWVKITGNQSWSRIFDFGSTAPGGAAGELAGPGGGGQGLDYFMVSAQVGSEVSQRRVEIRNDDGASGGFNTLDFPSLGFGADLHLAVTWSESTGDIRVYENGQLAAALTTDERLSGINDVNVWLGRSNWTGDQNAEGEYDEFRIYNRVLTAGEVLGNFQAGPDVVNVEGPVEITAQPQSQTVTEGNPATFGVAVSGSLPISYQWRRGVVPVAGATNAVYTLPSAALGDDQASFSVIVSNFVGGSPHTVLSSNVVLSVQPDVIRPLLVSASGRSLNSLTVVDGVQVEFNEALLASTATNTANYSLTGPSGTVLLNGATLDSSLRKVSLETAAPLADGATYTVAVNGVRDAAVAANLIAPNSQINFVAVAFTLRTIGSVIASNSVTAVPVGYDLNAAGRDIGSTSDDFSFHSQLRNGNFDVRVRLDSLGGADGYSRAGLMARDGLGTNATFAAVLASPGLGGMQFLSRGTPGAVAVGAGFLPVNYPFTWLRLQRIGNVFNGFGGFDGQSWLRLGTVTISMSAEIYLGFAVSSHDPATTVAARLREPSNVSGGTIVSSLTLPFEPLGPSTRRTGLVFSEIMYHPGDAPGVTNSLEFVEIFNAQEFFEDLGGFQLSGDIAYTFPPGTILQSGGFLVVARDPVAVQSHYGIAGVLGPFTNNLPNSGGRVRLDNELGSRLLEVEYGTEGEWPAAPDGAGPSLVLARASFGEGQARAWAASQLIGGSPGRQESFVPDPQGAVVINEFLAHTDDPEFDFIELFNTSTQPVNIGGAWLSDDPDTNKFRIPGNTILAGRSALAFDQNDLGFSLSAEGEQIILVNSNRTRVLDAIRFGGQANAVSRGRFPDGAPGFSELQSLTGGTANTPPLRRDVVINEIMYHPISENDDDEFIELHNRGDGPVNVSGWRFVNGVNFTIPGNTVINAGGYLVIARNRANLLARYPNLAATPALVIGDYSGQLANSGQLVALAMPDTVITTNGPIVVTNLIDIVVNEVNYRDGGRWGVWSDGGGSSLELIDPRADNRLAGNWADSDESPKAPWTLVERTALATLGMSSSQGIPNRFEMLIEGPGECLVDEVEVRSNGGANVVANGGFESGSTGWFFQGTHTPTSVQTGGAFAGNNSLRVRAAERGDPGANRIRTAIPTLATNGNNQATLRARVRWLRGDPNILLRVRGHWIELAGRMTLPTNLGTPGGVNSRAVANAGPAIYDVSHAPILPAASQPVVVTARVDDADGLSSLLLRYRIDPGATLTSVTMRDDGLGGDAIAADGLYSAIIPGLPANTLVAFHVRAQDGNPNPTVTQFPADAPARECLLYFGESLRPASIGSYRFWLTQSNLTYWANREKNSNEPLDCTFVYGNWRVVYNAKTLYSGSPWHTPNYNGPLGAICDYELELPKDDLFLGTTDFVLNGQQSSQTFFNNDLTAQAEATTYWMARKVGVPFNHKRQVFVYMNGQQRGILYFDHQQPNGDVLEEHFPDDAEGRLHKIEDWFEFDDAGSSQDIITATLQNFTVGGQKRTERYRWTWRPRAGVGPNDFANLFALVDAANANAPEPYTDAVLNIVDLENWMHVLAVQRMAGNWDSYGYERGKNMYAYKPTEGPWRLLLWDLDLVLGKDSRSTTAGLFNSAEPLIQKMYNHPPFRRAYLRALQELVSGPMLPQNYAPLIDARYAAFLAHGMPVQNPLVLKTWIDARRNYILTQLPVAPFGVAGPTSFSVSSNYLTLTGTAPIGVSEVVANGRAYPLTWTSVTNWSLRIPLVAGANNLAIQGLDRAGNVLATVNLNVNLTITPPPPEGFVVFNEILHRPTIEGAEFVELYNVHPTVAFDLTGWWINGLDYSFPTGAVVAPGSHLALAKNAGAYAMAHGARALADEYAGRLDTDGETLTLFRPGPLFGEEIVVDRVRYETNAPWSAIANLPGQSLQLVDSAQDNSRVSNWSAIPTNVLAPPQWVYVVANGTASSSTLYIYLQSAGDLYLDDLKLVSGSLPEAGANVLANGGFESSLTGTWTISTDFQQSVRSTNFARSGSWSLRMVATAAGSGNNDSISQIISPALANGAPYTLSFWYRQSTNGTPLTVRLSGSGVLANIDPVLPFGGPTPGAPNNVSQMLPPYPALWLNEAQADNLSGVTDNFSERDPWIELFNSGSNAINLSGLYLATNYANLTQWPFPSTVINPGQFIVVWADGQPGQSAGTNLHTSFRLSSGSGSVALSRLVNGTPQIVDYLNYNNVPANQSYGDVPDGQPFYRQTMYFASPRQTNAAALPPITIYVNEWMAGNTSASGISDPVDGDFEDWFELYNPAVIPVDLGGYYLTDNLTNALQFMIPNNGHYVVPPQGFLLVWADNEAGQNNTNLPDLHADFALSKGGEAIGLFAPDGTQIDAVVFGAQSDNVSQGRYPEGTGALYFMPTPTPRLPNVIPLPPVPPQFGIITVAGGTASFSFSITPGKLYRVEYKNDLNASLWTPLGADQPATNSVITIQDNVGTNSQRFYRVVILD